MSYLEEQYLRRVSYKLRNFKIKGNHTYNFSCPICNDSSKKLNKARGYAFDKSGTLVIHCHNCGYGATFPFFLKEIDQLLYKEYVMEKFKDKIQKDLVTPLLSTYIKKITETKKYVPNIFDGLPLVKDLPCDSEAAIYAAKRLLPLEKYELYYAEKFVEWTTGHTDKFSKWKGSDHSRLIIPFHARDGHIIGYTARAFDDNQDQKYYRIFVDEDEKEKFFGIDKLDETKQVYVFEGEIDSMSIPNSIAVSNGKLDTYMNKDAIYVPDADRRNKHIVKNIECLLEKGLKVCLMPEELPKDVNLMRTSGLTEKEILGIINENVYQGLVGKMKFNKWKIV